MTNENFVEAMDFGDISLIEVPVKIAGKDYILREASGGAAEKYRDASIAGMTFTDGKLTRVEGLAGVESLLVSLCLFNDKGLPVPLSLIRSWPSRVQKRLFERAKKISDLNESKIQDQITEAFERPDAPCSLSDLRGWIKTLRQDAFKELMEAFEPTAEEKAKNE